MSFLELLKIEFMKVKRGKIVPLIFIAPLLVVASGVANLREFFTPEYTNAWAAMFIQSVLVYSYYLLPFSMIVVCVMIAVRELRSSSNTLWKKRNEMTLWKTRRIFYRAGHPFSP